MTIRRLTKAEYVAAARFRHALRKYLRHSEEVAVSAGLPPQQYLAMLAVRGTPDREYVTVGELAERLQIKHHSAVELANRLEHAGYVRRQSADHDRRRVRIYLTELGVRSLDDLCSSLVPELTELAHELLQEMTMLVETMSGRGTEPDGAPPG